MYYKYFAIVFLVVSLVAKDLLFDGEEPKPEPTQVTVLFCHS